MSKKKRAARKCAGCGGPLSKEDIAAKETTCLTCAGQVVRAEISLESPLLAVVRLRLEGKK